MSVKAATTVSTSPRSTCSLSSSMLSICSPEVRGSRRTGSLETTSPATSLCRSHRGAAAGLVLRLNAGELCGRALRERPLEPLASREQPPTAHEHQSADDGDGRVVEGQPCEVVVPRDSGRGDREDEQDRDEPDPE